MATSISPAWREWVIRSRLLFRLHLCAPRWMSCRPRHCRFYLNSTRLDRSCCFQCQWVVQACEVDSNGSAYVGGIVGLLDLYDMVASIPALANVPAPCLAPASQGVTKSAYVSQVDATSGNRVGDAIHRRLFA